MDMKAEGENSMLLTEKDSVLTTDEAMEYLRISKPTFLKYIHVGRLRAIKAGKGWRILQSELSRFLKGEKNFGNA
jgi:excisionase family DNA binding protein